jgi:uncharacterized protein YbjT (DUF2867 family)
MHFALSTMTRFSLSARQRWQREPGAFFSSARSGRGRAQRTKGEVEDALARLGYAQLTILRPSLIDDEGARRDYRAGERLVLPLARFVFAVVGRTRRYAPISADVIAKAMVRLAFDNTTDRVRWVESDELHRLGAQK